MEGKDAIISRIINDSENLAKGIAGEAEEKAASLIQGARTMAGDYAAKANLQIEAEKAEIIRRRESVAKIDVKKAVLFAKQEMIEKAFNLAAQKIRESGEYKNFLKRLIGEYAEDGDTVVACKGDKDILNESLIKGIAASRGISLTLSKDYGNFNGGIIISSKGFDKNLTLLTLLSDIRESEEAAVADLLFKQGE